ncbi:MAG: hypothetical protein JNM62_10195 [Flavobacteriales bacterium]|nr:hypothetical protein [Flavobacteriales bacterium]
MRRTLWWAFFVLDLAAMDFRSWWSRLVHGEVKDEKDGRWVGWYWWIEQGKEPAIDKYGAIQHYRLEQLLSGSEDGARLVRATRSEILRELVRRKQNQYAPKTIAAVSGVFLWVMGIIAAIIAAYVIHRMGWN